MNLIKKATLIFSKKLLKELDLSLEDPLTSQHHTFKYLIKNGTDTAFGEEHKFGNINSIEDFQKNVPIRDYDQISPYIQRIREGENYVLWNQKVKWLAKSSGTSSDKSKFIPITKDNLHDCHFKGFRKMLVSYLSTYPKSRLFNGKSLTLVGALQPDELLTSALTGDLSAILMKNTPFITEFIREPSRKVALNPNFEQKLEVICKECSKYNITNFSGVPSWNLSLLLKLIEYNGVNTILDLWPNLELFMHGGVSFNSYRSQFERIIPKSDMHYVENYNASEGYFAFQDDPNIKAMRLALDSGVFFEFVPLTKLESVLSGNSNEVYTLEGVSVGVTYAIIITTNSGLWRYNIGDCVEFTSIFPHRLIITGRTKLFINAFGEELMINNAENALLYTCEKEGVVVSEYTVAPIYMTAERKGAHEWVIEFGKSEQEITPELLERFATTLDQALCKENSDYESKRKDNSSMTRQVITPVAEGTFYKWMKKRGKIGAQNKVPRLYNDRHFVDGIISFIAIN